MNFFFISLKETFKIFCLTFFDFLTKTKYGHYCVISVFSRNQNVIYHYLWGDWQGVTVVQTN